MSTAPIGMPNHQAPITTKAKSRTCPPPRTGKTSCFTVSRASQPPARGPGSAKVGKISCTRPDLNMAQQTMNMVAHRTIAHEQWVMDNEPKLPQGIYCSKQRYLQHSFRALVLEAAHFQQWNQSNVLYNALDRSQEQHQRRRAGLPPLPSSSRPEDTQNAASGGFIKRIPTSMLSAIFTDLDILLSQKGGRELAYRALQLLPMWDLVGNNSTGAKEA